MKKIILSIAVLIASILNIEAQSFSLEWDDVILGDTITIKRNSGSSLELVFEAIFHNKTSDSVNIKVARNDILIMEGSVNYFCWEACYPPPIDISGLYMTIPAGGYSEDSDFSGHYEINETIGISLVEYTFYNMDNPFENVKIVVKYDSFITGIHDNILSNIRLSEAYPNPATNFVTIDYDMPSEVDEASVRIVNILGSVVNEQIIESGNKKLRLDVSDLKDGIYFYSIIINDYIFSTKKLIIR